VTSVRLPALIGSSNSRLQPVALNAANRFRCRSQAGIAEDHRYCRWDTVPQRHRSRMHPRPPMVYPDGPRKPTYSRRSASRSFELVAWPNDMRRRATECRNSQLYQSRQRPLSKIETAVRSFWHSRHQYAYDSSRHFCTFRPSSIKHCHAGRSLEENEAVRAEYDRPTASPR
jgi:hypothetical protein